MISPSVLYNNEHKTGLLWTSNHDAVVYSTESAFTAQLMQAFLICTNT